VCYLLFDFELILKIILCLYMLKFSFKIANLFKTKFSKHKLLAELGLELEVLLLCDEFHVSEFMKIVLWVLGIKYIRSVLSSMQL